MTKWPPLPETAASIDAKWPPLPETAASIDATLKDIAGYIDVAAEAMVLPPEAAPRVEGAWPWAPGTIAQGFLGGRWNRRDGNVYASGAAAPCKNCQPEEATIAKPKPPKPNWTPLTAVQLDPIIDALLEHLPAPGDYWAKDDRKRWLQMIELAFDMIYDDESRRPRRPTPRTE